MNSTPITPDWTRDNLVINSSGSLSHLPTHYILRADPMDNLMIWVLHGRGLARECSHAVDAGPGDLILLQTGHEHEYSADTQEPWQIVWLHFSGPFGDRFVQWMRQSQPASPLIHFGLDELIRQRFEEIILARTLRTEASLLRADTAAYALLGLMMSHQLMGPVTTKENSSFDAESLQRWIQTHLDEPLTLDQLAEEAGMSVPHFTRLFRQHFGTSPIRYVIQQRVDRARLLLLETQLSIQEIARQLGYEDPFYFSRRFTHETGRSPRAYRHDQLGMNRKV